MNEHHNQDFDPASQDARGDGQDAPDAAPELPNFFARIPMVLFSPGALFQALAARPTWFPMLAFGSVAMAAASAVLPAEVWTEMMRQGSPEQAEAMAGIGSTVMRVMAPLGAMVTHFVFTIMFAGITYAALVFVRGDEAKFTQHLSVLAHVGVVSVLGVCFMVPFRIRSLDVTTTFSVGTFMPFLPEGYFAAVLGLMDLFQLWGAVVAGLGLSLLDPRRRWAPTAVVAVVLMVVLPALLMAIPTLFR